MDHCKPLNHSVTLGIKTNREYKVANFQYEIQFVFAHNKVYVILQCQERTKLQ